MLGGPGEVTRMRLARSCRKRIASFRIHARGRGEREAVADRLAVDDDELKHFMKLLNKSSDSLKGLRKALGEATVTGLGTDDLDSACEDFQEDWKYGTEQIGEQTENLAKIIGQSKDSYNEVDKALEEALRKGKHAKSGAGK
ncbi:hypothetical protein GCM10010121_031660 [Streptomyces brasiliensis]|uniref:Excreted virulence factor EspC, type VII ESX diderm n=1 Tax=Streptomyces brasiliensis TaxID=1954 RepID=A0A917KKT4_9ACTN|nr:hypothetical protein GCM10010121_031660 [Streptomyces brasiliensis]